MLDARRNGTSLGGTRKASSVIHAQTRTTAAANARLSHSFPPPDASAAKAARKATPVSAENAAQPRSPRPAKARTNTKHAAINARNPTPALAKCSVLCQLQAVGGPSGVPGGKPKAGSATKIPAAIRHAP